MNAGDIREKSCGSMFPTFFGERYAPGSVSERKDVA